jgi:hypothetical protein
LVQAMLGAYPAPHVVPEARAKGKAMTSTTFDTAQYKTRIRAEWRDAALGWRVWFDVLDAENAGFAVSRRLIQLAGIGPGMLC